MSSLSTCVRSFVPNPTSIPHFIPSPPSTPSHELSLEFDSTLVDVFQSAVASGKKLLEIGGPTPNLRALYGLLGPAGMDNVVRDPQDGYESRGAEINHQCKEGTEEETCEVDSFPYTFDGVTYGRTYLQDATSLPLFSDSTYSFIMSSHNLEHYLDPIAAVKAWDRVLVEGGGIFVVVPEPENMYDDWREKTKFIDLVKRHEAFRDNRTDKIDFAKMKFEEDILKHTNFERQNPDDPKSAEESMRAGRAKGLGGQVALVCL